MCVKSIAYSPSHIPEDGVVHVICLEGDSELIEAVVRDSVLSTRNIKMIARI